MEKDTIIQHFQQLYEIIQKARTKALHWSLGLSGLIVDCGFSETTIIRNAIMVGRNPMDTSLNKIS
jgi:hypothetical protein